MRLYLDSAQTSLIEPLLKTGVFYGVTTNPLILREAKMQISQLAEFADWVFGLGAKEVYFQSWGDDQAALYQHGQQLARISTKVLVKLPATRAGLEAAARLAKDGVRTCITAVYTAFQVLLAASVDAAYVAPYLGRMNDAGRDGHAQIAQMAEALRNTGSSTEILAASVRNTEDVARLAQNGVRCITLSPTVAGQLFQEPLTLEATRAFEAAAKEVEL